MEADYDGTGSFTVDPRLRLRAPPDAPAPGGRVPQPEGLRHRPQTRRAWTACPSAGSSRRRAVYGFISQSNVTDWDFLARLADENEHGDVRGRQGEVPVRQAEPVVRGALAADRRRQEPLRAPGRSRHPAAAGRRHRRRPGRQGRVARAGTSPPRRRSPRSRPPRPTRASPSAPPRARRPASSRPAKLVETSNPYDKQDEVKHAAEALADDVTSSFAELEVVVRGNPKLRPGRARGARGRRQALRGQVHRHLRTPRLRRRQALRVLGDGQRTAVALAVRAGLGRRRQRRPGCPASPTPSSPTCRTRSSRGGSGCSSRGWTTPTSATGRGPCSWAAWAAAASSRWTSATRCWSRSTGGPWTTRS